MRVCKTGLRPFTAHRVPHYWSRFYSVSTATVVDIDSYNDLKPDPDPVKTDLLVKLATCTKESISSDVDIIRIGEEANVGIKSLAPSTLYVRSFYPDLLTDLRK